MMPIDSRSRRHASGQSGLGGLTALALTAALGAACSPATPNDPGTVLALAAEAEDLALVIEQGDGCEALVRLEHLTTRATTAHVEERLTEQDARALRDRLGAVAEGLTCEGPDGSPTAGEDTTDGDTLAPMTGPSSGDPDGSQPPGQDTAPPGQGGPPRGGGNGNAGGGR